MHERNHFKSALTILQVIFGNIFYALFIKLFLFPSGLITGGTTGIGLAVNHYFHISISGVILIFNIAMLILAYFVLGKRFALTTIISTFAYPISLEFFNRILGNVVLTDDIFLCTIFSGIGIGLGLGIIIRSGASTGGVDIPLLILQKYIHIPLSVSLYVLDFCILLIQGSYNPAENVLYGILLAIIYSFVLDRMMILGNSKTEVKIISNKHEEIRKEILSDMDRGVTLLKGKGGYLQNPTEIILTIVSNRELPKITKLAQDLDPESFIIINRISEVNGRGFSMKKEYR